MPCEYTASFEPDSIVYEKDAMRKMQRIIEDRATGHNSHRSLLAMTLEPLGEKPHRWNRIIVLDDSGISTSIRRSCQ